MFSINTERTKFLLVDRVFTKILVIEVFQYRPLEYSYCPFNARIISKCTSLSVIFFLILYVVNYE